MTLGRWLLAGCAALLLAGPAAAQAPGHHSAWEPVTCDRACLIGHLRAYMAALKAKDPSRAAFAETVRFTENNVEMPIGEGVWNTVSDVSEDAMEAADPFTGHAAWFGLVHEHGTPAYYAMRIKVERNRIAEVETVIHRQTGLPAPFGDVSQFSHDPAFNEILPPEERRPRERLQAVADAYFDTVELNDGEVFAPFHEDCQRNENGMSTTSGAGGAAAIAQGCEAQFRLGIYNINKRIRERRYPLIDEERGVVVATGFFDHDNSYSTYKTKDGRTMRTALKWPNSITLIEAFRIKNGQIHRIEATFTYVPYFMYNPFSTPVPGAPNAVQPLGLGVR